MRDTSLVFFVPLGLKSQLRHTRSQSCPVEEVSSRSDTKASSSALQGDSKQKLSLFHKQIKGHVEVDPKGVFDWASSGTETRKCFVNPVFF